MHCTFYYLKGFNSLWFSRLWKLYFEMDTHCVFLGSYWSTVIAFSYCVPAALGNNYGCYPFNQNSDRSSLESGPPQKVEKFFRNFSGWTKPIYWVLDWNFWKILVEWITPYVSRVMTRMDTSKSGWTPYVYYTTLCEFKKWGNQSKRQLCKEKSWIQGLAPKYSD